MLPSFDALVLLADDVPAQGGEAPPSFLSWFPLLLIIALFYVMIILPQRREQKRRTELLGNLRKDDEVMTNGGIFGRVVSVSEETEKVVLKVDENARLTVHKSSIGTVLNKDAPEGGETKK